MYSSGFAGLFQLEWSDCSSHCVDQPHTLTGGIKRREGDLQVGGIGMGYVSVLCFSSLLGCVKLLNFICMFVFT